MTDTDPTPERRWRVDHVSWDGNPHLTLNDVRQRWDYVEDTLNEAETLRAERDEWEEQVYGLLDLLNATAVAVQGGPGVNVIENLPDLPNRAAALRAELAAHQFIEWQATVDRDRALVELEGARERVRVLESRLQRTAKVHHGLHWRSSAGNGTFEECQFDECEAARRALAGAETQEETNG